MLGSPLRLLLIITLFIIGSIFVFEALHSTPVECSRPDWQSVYLGWDDNAGPCTYLQRVSFDTSIILVYPLVIAWPLTLLWLVVGITYLFRRKSLRPDIRNLLIIATIGLLIIWYLFMVILQVLNKSYLATLLA